MELLFSYGTLQQKAVQLATFGRELSGTKEVLVGYQLGEIEITDAYVIKTSGKRFHPILRYTGNTQDQVQGAVFELTKQELEKADKYEVKDYQRVNATMQSGIKAWVYCESKPEIKKSK